MENRENQSPASGQETDLTKAQNQQQPSGEQGQQAGQSQFGQSQSDPSTGEQGQSGLNPSQQAPSGQADYGSAGQSDTVTQQRSDIEGGTATGQASGSQGGSQFVGSQSQTDTSSGLIEEEDAFPERTGDGE